MKEFASLIMYQFVDIKTLVYPGFATDLQQPITPLLFMWQMVPSFVTDTIYPGAFCKHVEELSAWVQILKLMKAQQR